MLVNLLRSSLMILSLAACSSLQDGQGDVPKKTETGGSHGIRPSWVDDHGRKNDRVFFEFDKYDWVENQNYMRDSQETLKFQADFLKSNPQFKLRIEGHADERGTREYNLALGERRAQTVKEYLMALGIPAHRLSTVSYGKERPRVLGSNQAAWSQNRTAISVLVK